MPQALPYQKTRELILYVAGKLCVKPNYGSTILNKALYFIDNVHYLRTGQPISEFHYEAHNFGPTPSPTQFLYIKQILIDSGDAEVQEIEYFGRVQKRLMAKRKANLNDFSGEEIEVIDSILATIEDWKATQASDLTHLYPAWQAAKNRELMPFYTFLISCKQPSEEEISWAKLELERVLGH